MLSTKNVTDLKRLLRRSHCPDRRRLITLARGRQEKELDRLAGAIEQPGTPGELLNLAMRPRVIC